MFSSRFNYLVSALGLKNVDIANAMFVDRSMVSRWRNGKREPKPEVVAQITKTVIDLCTTLDERLLLCRTVHLPYEPRHFEDTRTLEYMLTNWLSSSRVEMPASAEVIDNTPLPVSTTLLSGDGAYRHSIKTLMEMAVEAGEAFTIYFYADDPMDWFARDERFLADFQRLAAEATEMDLTVRLIFQITNDSKKMGNYVHFWSMLQSAGDAQLGGFYGIANRDANRRLFSHCIFAIPGIGAMTGWSVKDSPHKYVSLTVDEKETMRVVDDCELLWSQCIPIVRTHENYTIERLVNFLASDAERVDSREYLACSQGLPIGTLRPEMVREMLTEAGAQRAEADHILSVLYRYIEWFHSYTDLGIIDFYHTGNTPKKVFPHSLMLFGYSLSYTPERYLTHLKDTLEYARDCPNFCFHELGSEQLFPFDMRVAYGAYCLGLTEGHGSKACISTLQQFANCVSNYINEQAWRCPATQASISDVARACKKVYPNLDIDLETFKR